MAASGNVSQINIEDLDDELIDAPTLAATSQRIDRRLARELKREAKYFAELVPDVLASVGYDHWLRKESRPTAFESMFFGEVSRQKVRIMHVAYSETNLYLRIDPLRLPYRVTVPMLKDDEVLETLSVACGRKVTFQLRDYSNGCWFVINRDGVISSIPKMFKFKDAINQVPASSNPLKYCAGVGENMKLHLTDIEKMPHMLVAGATRFGKSVHLHAIILQLMWRNKPDRIKFLMIDLKGGMELQDYRDSQFLGKPIITEIEDVVAALREYKQEMFRRQKLFAGKARSLPEYNSYHSEKMPYIILVIDELAQVLRHPNREMSEAAMLELGSILSVARATGGHCILCTQRPSVDVVSGYLKTNIDTRVAFKTPTQADSRVILDSSHAADLELPGRAWMLDGAYRTQIQCPYISPTMIKRVVKAINEREKQTEREVIDIVQIAKLALEHHGGRLSRRALWEDLRDRISEKELRSMLSEFDNEVIEIDGQRYLVDPGDGGSEPRHLQVVEF